MENSGNDRKIDRIIEKINVSADSVKERETENGAREFEFGEANPKGLVFEFVPVNEAEDSERPDTKTEISEEFSVPDAFDANEKYNTPLDADGATKIWTTYVPRFTEVSENYRMVNDPRPKKSAPKTDTVAVSEQTSDDVKLDPTAELDSEVDGAVIVEMAKPEPEENSDTLNVYKFSENSEDGENTPKERTVEDERAEIDKLFSSTAEQENITEPEAVFSNPESAEPRRYTIPDPERDDIKVMDYGKSKADNKDAPQGASDTAPETKKRAFGEFTLPIQRDGFKDRFLDSLMSIKIRLGAAILFALVLLAFDTFYFFGAFGESLFSLPITPMAPAVIDFLFGACAFAVALPEIIRSVKYLLRGKPLPELMLPISFLAFTLYFCAIVGTGAVANYGLFGFMFAIFSVITVLASYYRTDADFTAFKLISKNGEKQILDKKMTRELPEENMALDGLIDEYKSKSARFFRASFITDFFSRTSKTSESPRRTVILLSVCSGLAIVAACVAFFLLDGIVSAASVLAFVFLLSSPVFAILSHKLPYHDSQKSALLEESTAVGETAYGDFSEVDVIAFDDTEIFGPDDVNLKRFMLYGDRDNMEKAMRQMCSLFSVIGGPLNFIFTNALDNRVRHSPAGNPEIEEDGLSGDVGGHRIAAGSEEYMLRHGIAIPEGASKTELGIDTTKVMYAAEDGEVYAKFYIRYSFSEEFTMLLPSLREEGIVPLVYTRDPNVSNELLKTLTAGADCMRVMKKLTPRGVEDKLYNRVSAGIVTHGEKINAISTVLLAKKYKKLTDRLAVSELYAMGVGAALALLLSLFGMKGVPTVIFGLWQIAWCVVLRFVSKKALLKDKSEEETTSNK